MAYQLLRNNGVNVVGTKKQIVFAAKLDFVATELAVVNLVALLNIQRNTLTIVIALAFAYGDNFAALWLFLRTGAYIQTGLGLLLLGCGLDENAITQRLQCHT